MSKYRSLKNFTHKTWILTHGDGERVEESTGTKYEWVQTEVYGGMFRSWIIAGTIEEWSFGKDWEGLPNMCEGGFTDTTETPDRDSPSCSMFTSRSPRHLPSTKCRVETVTQNERKRHLYRIIVEVSYLYSEFTLSYKIWDSFYDHELCTIIITVLPWLNSLY